MKVEGAGLVLDCVSQREDETRVISAALRRVQD